MAYTVLDTFAGAGGFSVGFELSGAQVIGAIEVDKWACETFKFNHPNTTVLQADMVDRHVKVFQFVIKIMATQNIHEIRSSKNLFVWDVC